MEQIPVVLIIAVLIGIIIFLLKDKKTKKEKGKGKKTTPEPAPKSDIKKIKNHIISKFNEIKKDKIDKIEQTKSQAFNGTIVQLADVDDTSFEDRIVKAYPIGVIPDNGICMNRASATFIPGQITIKPYRGYDNYISSDAYYIYTNNEGRPIISLKTSFIKKNGAYFDGERYINPILLYDITEDTSYSVGAFELVNDVAFSLGGDQWFLYKTWEKELESKPPIPKASVKATESPTQVFTNNNGTRRSPLYNTELDPSNLP